MKTSRWIGLLMVASVLCATGPRVGAEAPVDQWTHSVEFDEGLFASASYDAAERTLTLVFRHGAAYIYYDVHPDDFADFLRADNKGRFFNAHFRRFHHFERVSRYVESACREGEE